MAGPTRSTVDTSLTKRGHTKSSYNAFKLQELKRCLLDPVYFAETYIQIQHPTRGGIPFAMWDFQKDLVRLYAENRFSVALLPRQSGKCCINTTVIKVKNKKTGEIYEMNIGDFFDQIKKLDKS